MERPEHPLVRIIYEENRRVHSLGGVFTLHVTLTSRRTGQAKNRIGHRKSTLCQ